MDASKDEHCLMPQVLLRRRVLRGIKAKKMACAWRAYENIEVAVSFGSLPARGYGGVGAT